MGLPRPKSSIDRAAFLTWDADQPGKHEFMAGEVFAMVGARHGFGSTSAARVAVPTPPK